VNRDTTVSHQFLPWAALDPVTGDLWVVFYDRRATAGNATDVYVARSTDAGESWIDFRVSESSFTPSDRYFLGDYIGIAAYGGRAHPIWTRMEGSFTSVWTAIVAGPASTGIDDARHPAPGIAGLHGGSFGGMTTVTYVLPRSGHVSIELHDAFGGPVRRLVDAEREEGMHSAWWDGRDDDGTHVANGVYFVVMKTDGRTFVRKMTLVR
jgi:hypothetical protein